MLHIAFGCGMRFSAVDAAFSKHIVYREGYLHLLTTRDGDNKTIVLAWAVCETESGDAYKYFSSKCHEAGLTRYLNGSSIIFSDRQKGIKEFHDKFPAKVGRCFKHIIENCRKHVHGTGQNFKVQTAWALRNAATEAEYKVALARLKRESPRAAKYFDDIKPHVEVFQYAMNAEGVATHGFKTSQIVESLNGVFVKARMDAPYRLNAQILKWQGERLEERTENMKKWIQEKHPLTQYATQLFQVQVYTWAQTRLGPNTHGPQYTWAQTHMGHNTPGPKGIHMGHNTHGPKHTWATTRLGPNTHACPTHHQVAVAQRAGQEVTSSGAGVYYVTNVRSTNGRQHEVLLDKKQCCDHVVMHQQPCRHMVCVFYKIGLLGNNRRTTEQTIRKFWPKYFHSDNYLKMYEGKTIRQPLLYTGKYTGPPELRVLRPRQPKRKRGRPRITRWTWRRKTVKDVERQMGPPTHAQYQQVLRFF